MPDTGTCSSCGAPILWCITRNGKNVGLLMSMDEWESWEETFEVLQDEELLESLKRSEEDVKAGRLVELDDVLRRRGRA